MKKIFKLLFFLASVHTTYSQYLFKATLIDSLTKKAVPYATIKVKNAPLGTYTDANGFFEIIVNDSNKLLISSISYFSKIVTPGIVRDSIFLTPKPLELESVVLTQRKLIGSGFFGIRKASIDIIWGPSGRGEEFAQKIMLPKTNNYYLIKKIILPIKNFNPEKPVVVHMYKEDPITNLPAEDLISNNYIVTKKDIYKNTIIINVENQHIIVYNENIFIGFEWLGSMHRPVSYKTPTLLKMTYAESQKLTFSRLLWEDNDKWMPAPLPFKAPVINTIFSVEAEIYR